MNEEKAEALIKGVERLAQDQQMRRFFPEYLEILSQPSPAVAAVAEPSKEQSPAQ